VYWGKNKNPSVKKLCSSCRSEFACYE